MSRQRHGLESNELLVEIPFKFDPDSEDARSYWLEGVVRFGYASAHVSPSTMTCIDQRTLKEVELDNDAALELAETALVEEAKILTKKAWSR